MEELRSTEILDREIQEDARRKAEKILKTSESECRQITEDVARRIERVREEREREYRSAVDSYLKDAASAVPLEKQRRLVSYIDGAVNAALDSWLSGLGSERKLALYAGVLSRYRPAVGKAKVAVRAAGFPEKDVRSAVASSLGGAEIVSFETLSAGHARSAGFEEGILVESADGSLACRATSAEIREELLINRREELAKALFGGRLPE